MNPFDLQDAAEWRLYLYGGRSEQERFNAAMRDLDRQNGVEPDNNPVDIAPSVIGVLRSHQLGSHSISAEQGTSVQSNAVSLPVQTNSDANLSHGGPAIVEVPNRPCACGCGEQVQGNPKKIYLNSTHRWRHKKREQRARTGK
jgi:hypothetical protein